jgi:glutamate racemase
VIDASIRSPSSVTIGVRDSGVGGLTVAKQILKAIPNANLLYFADTAHVPYGNKTAAQIRHYALSITDFLIGQGAQIVVFACNTTSAYALDLARQRFSQTPIFGVIEPGARVAAQVSSGRVGVLATTATVQSCVYTKVLRSYRSELKIKEIGCPAFVPLVESEQAASCEALEACQHYLAPLQQFGVDSVVLGCTHYPLLLPQLQQVAPELRFIDPAIPLAQDVYRAIDSLPKRMPSAHRFFVSGEKTGVENWIGSVLGIRNPSLEDGPIFDYEVERSIVEDALLSLAK